MFPRLRLLISSWRTRQKTESEEMSWHRKPLSVLFLYLFILLLWVWEYNIPSPGKAATVLAVVAAVMTFRGDMRGGEKLAWTVLLFGFMYLEITSIDTERKANEYMRSVAMEQERKSFDSIGRGIQANLAQSQQQFTETMEKEAQVSELSRRNLLNITGGNSYAVVEPVTLPTLHPEVPLFIRNHGHNILTGISVTLYESGVWLPMTHASIMRSNEERITGLTLSPGERMVLPKPIKPELFMPMKENENQGKDDMYRVFVTIAAQNFTSTEYLDFKKGSNQGWEYSYKIYREPLPGQMRRGRLLAPCLMESVTDWETDSNRVKTRKPGPCANGVEKAKSVALR